jgi:hypothetical protein
MARQISVFNSTVRLKRVCVKDMPYLVHKNFYVRYEDVVPYIMEVKNKRTIAKVRKPQSRPAYV